MHKRIPILLGFIFLAIAIWLQLTAIAPISHFINRIEQLAYDLQLRTNQLTTKAIIQSPIVIVDINEKSLSKEGRWPWPREQLANLVKNIKEAGAAVIAFDIVFPLKEENPVDQLLSLSAKEKKVVTPETMSFFNNIRPYTNNDALFAQQLHQIDSILAISFIAEPDIIGAAPKPLLVLTTPQEESLGFISVQGILSNIPELATAAKSVGFINSLPDEDGIIRRLPLLIRYQNNLYPSLALEAVRIFLFAKVKLVTASYHNESKLEGIMIGDYKIPTDEYGQVVIPFRGMGFTFPYISAEDILNKKFPPDMLQGKIVFVGTSATGLGDLKTTAIQNAFPGIEIHATIADGILTHHFSYKPAWALGAEISITFLLGAFFALVFPYVGPRLLSLLMLIIPILLFFCNHWIWNKSGLIITIFIPIFLCIIVAIMNIIYGYIFESRRREHLKNIFAQYVPTTHIDEMLKKPGRAYGLHGETRTMTVLFSDIRGFTTITETMSAATVKDFLYEIFTPMTEIIFKHKGTIDKYVGDLIMAFWGAPLKDKNHAQHAMYAALEMQQALQKIQTIFVKKDWPPVQLGIGINSGLMNIGDMGSKFRLNYTVLGDEVNIASRVESLTKNYDVQIIVTEHTQHDQKNFVFQKLDRVRVRGKKVSIEIYELICKRTDASQKLLEDIHRFETALDHYFQQRWDEACDILLSLQQQYPEKKLYELYLKRIAELKKQTLHNWDGVYISAVPN